jgi:phage terminase large subunit-like protein
MRNIIVHPTTLDSAPTKPSYFHAVYITREDKTTWLSGMTADTREGMIELAKEYTKNNRDEILVAIVEIQE